LVGILSEAIEAGVGDDRVVEESKPVGDGTVAGEDDGFFGISFIDDVVEALTGKGVEGSESEVVEHEQIDLDEFFEEVEKLLGLIGEFELVPQFGCFEEEGGVVSSTGFMGERFGQMGFTGSGGADEEDAVSAGEIVAAGELADMGGGDGGIEEEVEGFEGLVVVGEAGLHEQSLEFALQASFLFVGKEQGEEFAVGEVVLLGFEQPQFEALAYGGEFEAFELALQMGGLRIHDGSWIEGWLGNEAGGGYPVGQAPVGIEDKPSRRGEPADSACCSK